MTHDQRANYLCPYHWQLSSSFITTLNFTGETLHKTISVFLAVCVLSACQAVPNSPSKAWVVSSHTDEFTDSVIQMIIGSTNNGPRFFATQTASFYPFVGKQDGKLHVGVRSGGSYRIPTGTVQLRIDDNSAWTITPEETPATLVPGSASADKSMSQETMRSMSKILSPFTVASGDKAIKIIKQMAAGKVLKYRTVGMNQAASTTGEVPLDSSFAEGLAQLGINPASLSAQ